MEVEPPCIGQCFYGFNIVKFCSLYEVIVAYSKIFVKHFTTEYYSLDKA